jgi:hypothetical protein
MENLIPARKNMIDYINYVTATHASKRYFRKILRKYLRLNRITCRLFIKSEIRDYTTLCVVYKDNDPIGIITYMEDIRDTENYNRRTVYVKRIIIDTKENVLENELLVLKDLISTSHEVVIVVASPDIADDEKVMSIEEARMIQLKNFYLHNGFYETNGKSVVNGQSWELLSSVKSM